MPLSQFAMRQCPGIFRLSPWGLFESIHGLKSFEIIGSENVADQMKRLARRPG